MDTNKLLKDLIKEIGIIDDLRFMYNEYKKGHFTKLGENIEISKAQTAILVDVKNSFPSLLTINMDKLNHVIKKDFSGLSDKESVELSSKIINGNLHISVVETTNDMKDGDILCDGQCHCMTLPYNSGMPYIMHGLIFLNTKSEYNSDGKLLIHELCHCLILYYHYIEEAYVDVNFNPEELKPTQEEFICDLLSFVTIYGESVGLENYRKYIDTKLQSTKEETVRDFTEYKKELDNLQYPL